MNETLKVIRNRRAIRKFKPEQIKDEELNAIVEAGLYAPSANNLQAWHFTVIQNKDVIMDLNEAAKDSAKDNPDEMVRKLANEKNLNVFYGAPTVMIVAGEEGALMADVDCAVASENMMIAAESLDIGGCWNGLVSFLFQSDKADEYKEKLGIPKNYTPYYGLVFGYKDMKEPEAPKRKEHTVNYIK